MILSATITLAAGTLRSATAAALSTVECASGEKASGVEVLPNEEHDRRTAEPLIPELVGYAEIAEMLGVSRQRAVQLGETPGFPPAVVTTKAGPLRVKARVEAWAATWERRNGLPRKAPSRGEGDQPG